MYLNCGTHSILRMLKTGDEDLITSQTKSNTPPTPQKCEEENPIL